MPIAFSEKLFTSTFAMSDDETIVMASRAAVGRNGLTSLSLGGYFAVVVQNRSPACIICMQVIQGARVQQMILFARLGVPRALNRLILPS